MSYGRKVKQKNTRARVRKAVIFILTVLIILTVSIVGKRAEEEWKEQTFQIELAEKYRENIAENDPVGEENADPVGSKSEEKRCG